MAGIGAAAIAAAITLTMMMSSPAPVATSDQAATTSTKQCQVIQRKLYVSTTTGGGTVRLRGGSYLSPPIKLSATPTPVVFPLPRPDTVAVEEVLTIEGNASDVVITSDVTNLRQGVRRDRDRRLQPELDADQALLNEAVNSAAG